MTILVVISLAMVTGEEGSEGDYTTYDEMVAHLEELNSSYPEIVGLYNLSERYGVPLTHQNRTIWAVKLSDNPHQEEEDEVEVLYCGAHHGREWATVEVVLNFLDYMVENYESDPRVSMLIDEREMWLVPMVNPDGHSYSVERLDNFYNNSNNDGWRKNLRDNDGDGELDDLGTEGGGDGVDLNRNYQYLWFDRRQCSLDPDSLIYRGPYDMKDDDGDWQGWDGENWNDDLNMNHQADIDWDGPEVDGNDDGELAYDPEPHVNEDYVDGVDNDGDGLVDEDPAGGLTEPETMAIMALALDPDHDFRALFTYHAYGEYYLMNRGVESEGDPPEFDQMRELGYLFIDMNEYYLNDQSSYGTTGMCEDWFYYQFGTFGYTIEVGTEFIPPEEEIERIESENLEQNLILAEYAPVTNDIIFLDGFEIRGGRKQWLTEEDPSGWNYTADPTPGNGGTNGISGDHYMEWNGSDDESFSEMELRNPIDLTKAIHPVLSFWHRYELATSNDERGKRGTYGDEPYALEGGLVEIRRANGPWIQVHPTSLYPMELGNISASGNNGFMEGYSQRPVFSGSRSSWTQITFDISDFVGEVISIRFIVIIDPDLEEHDPSQGWAIDNVAIIDAPEIPFTASVLPSVVINTSPAFMTGNENFTQFIWWSSVDGELYNGTGHQTIITNLSIGYHTIYFRGRDEEGNWSDIIARSLIVHQRPLAFIDGIGPSPAIISEPVIFSAHGEDDGPIQIYLWASNIDGELYVGSNASFGTSQLSKGNHTIRLRVIDDHQVFSDIVTTSLIVHHRPIATIHSISPDPALDSESILFNGSGSDDDDDAIVQYSWSSDLSGEFYNGTDAEFNHSGLSSGDHRIFFKVMDEHQAWSVEAYIDLFVHKRPVAFISEELPSVALNTDVINLSGYGVDDNGITSYIWRSSLQGEMYNGTSGSSIQFIDPVIGTHMISLTVRDGLGVWSAEVSRELLIHERPIATITSSPSLWVYVNESVQFSGVGSDDGKILAYTWSSSISGILSLGPDPEFESNSLTAGEHRISFIVQDDQGVWSFADTMTIVIHEYPLAIINSINPATAMEHEMIHFSAVKSSNLARYLWASSLDGEFSNTTSSSISYSGLSNGTHIISLLVMDKNVVWSDPTTIEIHVNGKPVVEILEMTPNPSRESDSVMCEIVVHDDGTVQNYVLLSSIDGTLYDGPFPSFTIHNISLGFHTLQLRIQDNHGVWSDPYTTYLEVMADPIPNELPEIEITEPHGQNSFSGSIRGTAQDPDGTVERVEVSIDGGNWLPAKGTKDWHYTFDIRHFPSGNHSISVRAFDGEDYSEILEIIVTIGQPDPNDGTGGVNDGNDTDGDSDNTPNSMLLLTLIAGLGLLVVCLFLPWDKWMK